MKLLEQTVRELKGEEIEDDRTANVNVQVDLRIDDGYVPDMNQRLTVYRRMGGVRSAEELERVAADVRDRYGPLPASVLNLAEYARVRLLAGSLGIESIDREGRTVVIKFRGDAPVDPGQLIRIVQGRPELKLIPPGTLRLDLSQGATGPPPVPAPRPAARNTPGPPPKPAERMSWWTARARTGVVAPGFSREEILRQPQEDPRGIRGILTRLTELLAELSRTVRID
jgi:transcription-repair coupling factor (superfamily II helicase)